jgi:hypothetical protein
MRKRLNLDAENRGPNEGELEVISDSLEFRGNKPTIQLSSHQHRLGKGETLSPRSAPSLVISDG